ncbi:hypothetical protein WT60_27625 [Burkholderia sp. MSMB617WGS]|uniref:Uncharacterized protein n=1 Tax=Burkholderia savannae TaxID=1637837 RepID=A0ABR5T6C9_9BURK|nr:MULTISPECIES: hypothetical protein [Burkholderia]AOK50561.1 hypothetical protein WT60_27625 [Burkholderia sp. MSMB617WGS]KWZ38782.1 hypothetical protein WS72_28685 [Burkholderia savannae]
MRLLPNRSIREALTRRASAEPLDRHRSLEKSPRRSEFPGGANRAAAATSRIPIQLAKLKMHAKKYICLYFCF